jgi:hypothetical protein
LGRGRGGQFAAQTGRTANRGGLRGRLPKMGMAVAIQVGPACLGAGEVDHGRRWRMNGSRCSWATGQRGQREAQGRVAAWHTEAEEEKGKGGGVRLSARGRRKERGGSGSVHGEGEKKGGGVRRLGTAWRRRAWGASGWQGARPVEAVVGRHLSRKTGEQVARVGRPGKMRELGRV